MGELYRLVSPGEVTDDLEHWPFVKADPAEVLAEMGGERVWMCRHGHITEYPERCELDGCWVWLLGVDREGGG